MQKLYNGHYAEEFGLEGGTAYRELIMGLCQYNPHSTGQIGAIMRPE